MKGFFATWLHFLGRLYVILIFPRLVMKTIFSDLITVQLCSVVFFPYYFIFLWNNLHVILYIIFTFYINSKGNSFVKLESLCVTHPHLQVEIIRNKLFTGSVFGFSLILLIYGTVYFLDFTCLCVFPFTGRYFLKILF